MLNLVKLPKARRDIVEIVEYIGLDSEAHATRFLDAIEAECSRLRHFPALGQRVCLRRVADNVRRWGIEGFDAYSIFYRVKGDELQILRVLHGARNLPSELRRR